MTDEKVYTPEEIEDTSLPGIPQGADYSVSQPSSGQTISTERINDQGITTKRIATELLSTSLNTKSKRILAEYQFTSTGAIKVGEYTPGVNGDIRISPDGIVARNASGITTFVLDGTTGDATFAGTIQAGTLIGGEVLVGDGHVVIDGDNKRIVIFDDDDIPRVFMGYQAGGF